MVEYSSYWKEELLRCARRIEHRQVQKRWVEGTFAGLEKDVMLGFYSFRKLVEANTISNEICDRAIKLRTYANNGERVTFFNRHKVSEKYDLENPGKTKQKPLWIANSIVHSFVFMPVFDDNSRLIAIWFNSDRTRRETLYEIDINDIVSLFRELGLNNPASITANLDVKKGDYEVWVGPSLEPVVFNVRGNSCVAKG